MEAMNGRSSSLRIEDASAAGEVRRVAGRMASLAGLSEREAGAAALVATEAATNIVKHAGRGEVLLREVDAPSGLEILALDRGRGMSNVESCMRDGYSTAGSSGTGLGAMRRMSSNLEIYSQPGKGTAVFAEIRKRSTEPPPLFQTGAVSVPKSGEEVCGDGWAVLQERDRLVLLVVDGLGHGPVAAQAAREAQRVFTEAARSASPTDLLERMHGALRTTRGAAAAVAEVDTLAAQVRFAGVGNIAGMVRSQGVRRQTVSHNGTVGGEIRKVHEFTYPWSEDALLLLHSDGINTNWQLENYPGLAHSHPALIAGVLYRDANRGRDDATVVVARLAGGLP
jgi:anti-sigma regulatory factor (Ser/Thr protein kinase)